MRLERHRLDQFSCLCRKRKLARLSRFPCRYSRPRMGAPNWGTRRPLRLGRQLRQLRRWRRRTLPRHLSQWHGQSPARPYFWPHSLHQQHLRLWATRRKRRQRRHSHPDFHSNRPNPSRHRRSYPRTRRNRYPPGWNLWPRTRSPAATFPKRGIHPRR